MLGRGAAGLSQFIFLFFGPSAYLSVLLSVGLFNYLSVCVSVSVCLPVCASVYLHLSRMYLPFSLSPSLSALPLSPSLPRQLESIIRIGGPQLAYNPLFCCTHVFGTKLLGVKFERYFQQ